MSYRIVLSKRASRDLKKMDPDAQSQIRSAIDKLATRPRQHSSKRMKGDYKGCRRERTGDYRIIYEVREEELIVLVIGVGNRKDIYR